jgi:hypothetical protein
MYAYFTKHRGNGVYLPLVAIAAADGVSHTLAALATGRRPLETARAYALGFGDVLARRSPWYGENGGGRRA